MNALTSMANLTDVDARAVITSYYHIAVLVVNYGISNTIVLEIP